MAELSVQPDLEALIRDFIAPDAPYELITADVDGKPQPRSPMPWQPPASVPETG